jgi:hypothetical protein
MLEDLTGSCSLDHRYLGKVSESAFAIPSGCGVLAANRVLPNRVKGCGKVTQIVRIFPNASNLTCNHGNILCFRMANVSRKLGRN